MPVILILLGMQGAGCTAAYFAYKYCNKMYKLEEETKREIKRQHDSELFFELLNWEIDIYKEFTILDAIKKISKKYNIDEDEICKQITAMGNAGELKRTKRDGINYYRR